VKFNREKGVVMFKKILLPLDGSDLAECALGYVEELAKAVKPGQITLARVVQPVSWSWRDTEFGPTMAQIGELEKREMRASAAYLEMVKGRLAPLDIPVTTEVLFGWAAENLVDYASKNGVDLIVMSSHGRSGIKRWLMGSVADKVMRISNTPVLLLRAPGCSVNLKEVNQEGE
jgi:nucleotide-binding universal stress UspA family protein